MARTILENSGNPAKDQLIVSLTTVPERVELLSDCIETLLNQQFSNFIVILWVYDEIFKQRGGRTADVLPHRLTRLMSPNFMLKNRPDIGPHTKLIHALREYPAQIVVTADDDCLYPADWLAELVESYQNAPQMIHCHRAHLITLEPNGRPRPYADWSFTAPGIEGPDLRLFPTGHGGVLYPPNALHPTVFDVPLFQALCPTADDVWFKAMSLLQGTTVKKVRPTSEELAMIDGSEVKKLWDINFHSNDLQIQQTFDHFDLSRYFVSGG